MSRKIVIAGIGTDTGKTVVAAIVTEALGAYYWKPLQCGEPKDKDTIAGLISDTSKILEEAVMLQAPMSPHAAAALEGRELKLSEIELPAVDGDLVIELAGGLMVPLNDNDLNIDMVESWGDEVELILVADYYLGSINHTLLSLDLLRRRDVNVTGIIFNGETVESTKSIIMENSHYPVIGEIGKLEPVNAEVIKEEASRIDL